MSEPTSSLAILWKVLAKFFPSIVGSFLAVVTMKFDKDANFKTKIVTASIAFASGIAMSHYVGGFVISIYPTLDPVAQDGIKFALGIFGLTIINNIYEQVNPWLTALRKKLLGAENG